MSVPQSIHRPPVFYGGRSDSAIIGVIMGNEKIVHAAASAASTAPSEDVITFRRTAPPEWLLALWKEIDDKTFGEGFNCFREDAIWNLGVGDWHGREAIIKNVRAFIDTGFTALHVVDEYWDGGALKVFRGSVTMTPDDGSKPVVRPVMTHFLYMDEADHTKVRHWYGSVGPLSFTAGPASLT